MYGRLTLGENGARIGRAETRFINLRQTVVKMSGRAQADCGNSGQV